MRRVIDHADGGSTEVWGPLHAWRALGQLCALEAIELLISQLQVVSEDDWAQEEIDRVFALIGPAAIKPLEAHLCEPRYDEYARAIAVNSLKQIALRYPEQRARVLAACLNYMTCPDKEAFALIRRRRPTSARYPRWAAMTPAPVAAERSTSVAVCIDGARPVDSKSSGVSAINAGLAKWSLPRSTICV